MSDASFAAAPPSPPPLSTEEPTPRGFWISLATNPTMTERELRDFERRMEDFLEERDLCIHWGTQLQLYITPMSERAPSLSDAVSVLDWCLGTACFSKAALSEFTDHAELPPDGVAVLRVQYHDLAMAATSLLFRLGRATPQQFVQLLGGLELIPGGLYLTS